MGKLLITVALLACAALCVEAVRHNQEILKQFKAWQHQHKKRYASTAAFDTAVHNFEATLQRIAAKNKAQSRARFGLTPFADLSPAEFRAQYLNLDGKALRAELQGLNLPVAPPQPLDGPLPDDFDWNTKDPNSLTYVKDQGQCGSCWAFSVVENIESQYYLAGKFPGNQIVDLSPQQIVDCDNGGTWGDQGCDGGYTQGALDYVHRNGGIETEADYPYFSGDSGSAGNCVFDATKIAAKIDGWQYAVPMCNDSCDHQNATLLQQQLVAIGPLSICVVATDDWQDYTWGVLMADCPHDAADINHGVQLTGYADGKNEGWWIIRNSWGDSWGMQGYIWVDMPNDCGVADIVTYAVVNK